MGCLMACGRVNTDSNGLASSHTNGLVCWVSGRPPSSHRLLRFLSRRRALPQARKAHAGKLLPPHHSFVHSVLSRRRKCKPHLFQGPRFPNWKQKISASLHLAFLLTGNFGKMGPRSWSMQKFLSDIPPRIARPQL